MRTKLQPNQCYMAFEDYNHGLIQYFDKFSDAKAWAKEQREKNKTALTTEEKDTIQANYEHVIYIDIIKNISNGSFELVDTIWDCPLF